MKAIPIIRWVFLLVGSALLIGGGVLFQDTRSFVANAEHTVGTVIALDARTSTSTTTTSGNRRRTTTSTSYYPVVRFRNAGGQEIEFTASFGSNPAPYDRGERVGVLYDPADPKGSARLESFGDLYFTVVMLGGIGALFFLIGASMLVSARRAAARKQWLEMHGRRVTANINEIERNTNIKIRNRSPYRIVCQWQDPGTEIVHVFESDNIWFDPKPFVKHDTVEVLLDANNPGRYWVDTSFLPSKA